MLLHVGVVSAVEHSDPQDRIVGVCPVAVPPVEDVEPGLAAVGAKQDGPQPRFHGELAEAIGQHVVGSLENLRQRPAGDDFVGLCLEGATGQRHEAYLQGTELQADRLIELRFEIELDPQRAILPGRDRVLDGERLGIRSANDAQCCAIGRRPHDDIGQVTGKIVVRPQPRAVVEAKAALRDHRVPATPEREPAPLEIAELHVAQSAANECCPACAANDAVTTIAHVAAGHRMRLLICFVSYSCENRDSPQRLRSDTFRATTVFHINKTIRNSPVGTPIRCQELSPLALEVTPCHCFRLAVMKPFRVSSAGA